MVSFLRGDSGTISIRSGVSFSWFYPNLKFILFNVTDNHKVYIIPPTGGSGQLCSMKQTPFLSVKRHSAPLLMMMNWKGS